MICTKDPLDYKLCMRTHACTEVCGPTVSLWVSVARSLALNGKPKNIYRQTLASATILWQASSSSDMHTRTHRISLRSSRRCRASPGNFSARCWKKCLRACAFGIRWKTSIQSACVPVANGCECVHDTLESWVRDVPGTTQHIPLIFF